MYTFYEQQHPDHTERRRQALRDAATKDRAIRRLRHANDNSSDTPLPPTERRRLLAMIATDRARADEIHVDPLDGRSDPLDPRRSRHAWQELVESGMAWALTMVLVVSIVVMVSRWP